MSNACTRPLHMRQIGGVTGINDAILSQKFQRFFGTQRPMQFQAEHKGIRMFF